VADDGHRLQAEILTPEGEVFSGGVHQISTRTKVGEIGILANHAPVLARLVPTELRLHITEGEVRRFAQAEGWLQVFANRALLLVEEAIEPGDLDEANLRARLEDAESRISNSEEGSAHRAHAEQDKTRAEAFLSVAAGES
jgi:F-type H+-transporting ATPase subunit epsilon